MSDRKVRPRDAKILIQRAFTVKKPMFMWGPPGIGKSDIIATIAKETNRPVIDMRLLLMEPTDLKGIPYFCPKSLTMKWAKPSELPAVITADDIKKMEGALVQLQTELKAVPADDPVTRNEVANAITHKESELTEYRAGYDLQTAILFLDELNAAPPSVQAAAYQLILNRRIGNYYLPDGVSIVAAGNRESDKGVTFRMPSPLANRFTHIELEANFEDWQRWAINAGVHAEVIGFLSHHKQHLFTFDAKSPDKAFATPRSWTTVADLIDDNLPESLNTTLVAGTVGEGLAIEFAQHRKIASKLPKPDDILTGRVKDLNIKDISAMYSLSISMCYTLQEWVKKAQDVNVKDYDMKDWNENVDHFFRYTMDNFGTEMIVLGAKTALRDYKLPIDHRLLKNFKEFHQKYGSYILDD